MTIWRMIPHSTDRDWAIGWCIEHQSISMGWGKTGDLRDVDLERVGAIVSREYGPSENPSTAAPSLRNIMALEIGDLVVIAGKQHPGYVVEVAGPYRYASLRDSFGDYQHQRPVRFTDLRPSDYWTTGVSKGENKRWTLARVSEPTTFGLVEGARRQVLSTTIERKSANRRACLDHHGYRCHVCDLLFEERYGEIGRGFIEVHHTRPLAQMDRPEDVDPIRDLVPLCPNCHAMIHKQKSEPFTVEQLRARLRINV